MSLLLWLLLGSAHAGQLGGVTLPDTATVGGQPVVLNGMGLREKYFIDVYVGGLYLPEKTTDSQTAISSDVAKRLTMHFLYKQVTADQLSETFREGFGAGASDTRVGILCSFMEDVGAGDEVVLDYVPGKGTTVSIRGTVKGTIEGADFMRKLWTVYLGPVPPTEKLKRGLLGR